MHKVAGTEYTYQAKDLLAVYFGPEISQTDVEIICLILQGQNEQVKFYNSVRSEQRFRLDFKEMNYIPHTLAKRLGLLSDDA